MKKLTLVFFLIFILVFSGCATFSGGKSKTPEVDRTGEGLKVTFEVDEKWISVRQLEYKLTLKNSGVEPVVLKKENFLLKTDVKMQDGSSVIEQASLDNFYKTLFKDSDTLTIYHDQKISDVTGSLYIKDEFFKKRTQEKFQYVLSTKYDYKTNFSNNVQIDLKSSELLKVLDSLSQAAPVQVKKIELKRLPDEQYAIYYYLKDMGQLSDNQRSVKLKNIQINFRTTILTGCKGLVFKDGVYKEVGIESLVINADTPEVIVACKVSFTDEDKAEKFITTTFGSFEYSYNIDIVKAVTLPAKISEQVVWQ